MTESDAADTIFFPDAAEFEAPRLCRVWQLVEPKVMIVGVSDSIE